jgi:hypothetical protein
MKWKFSIRFETIFKKLSYVKSSENNKEENYYPLYRKILSHSQIFLLYLKPSHVSINELFSCFILFIFYTDNLFTDFSFHSNASNRICYCLQSPWKLFHAIFFKLQSLVDCLEWSYFDETVEALVFWKL